MDECLASYQILIKIALYFIQILTLHTLIGLFLLINQKNNQLMSGQDFPSKVPLGRYSQKQQQFGEQFKICKLCFNRFPQDKLISISDCKHIFCTQCQITKILESLDWKQQAKCPVDQCQAILVEGSKQFGLLSRDTQLRIIKLRENLQNNSPNKMQNANYRISKKEYENFDDQNLQKQNAKYRRSRQDIAMPLIQEQPVIAARKVSIRQKIIRILLYPLVLATGVPIAVILLMTTMLLGLLMGILFIAGYLAIGVALVCYFMIQIGDIGFQLTLGAFIGLIVSIILFFIHKAIKERGIQQFQKFCEFSLRFTRKVLVFPCPQ